MTLNVHELDDRLASSYLAQSEQYDRALKLVTGLADAFQTHRDSEELLQQIQSTLDTVARLDTQIAPLKRDWKAARRRPSGRLSAAMSGIEDRIGRLLQQVQTAEQAAQQAKDRLSPQVDAELRSKQMQSAYGSVQADRLSEQDQTQS